MGRILCTTAVHWMWIYVYTLWSNGTFVSIIFCKLIVSCLCSIMCSWFCNLQSMYQCHQCCYCTTSLYLLSVQWSAVESNLQNIWFCPCVTYSAMDQLIASTITAVGISIDQNSLKSLFDELGVEKPSDVALIWEGDLTGLLKPVQARKVIANFKSLECLAVADPDEPVEACTNTTTNRYSIVSVSMWTFAISISFSIAQYLRKFESGYH